MNYRKLLPALVAFVVLGFVLSTAHAQSPVVGDWAGTLDVGVAQLHLVLHISGMPDALHATMDSVDQHANGIPVTTITLKDTQLDFALAALHASYTGKLSKDGMTLHGTFTQGQPFDLDFHHSAAGGAGISKASPPPSQTQDRPQNPIKPYPYQSIDVTYVNTVQHNTLAATLTLPQGKGPFPAVLLLTGSGPQDRDESLLGHKPFLVLSDYLTRHGIAVLRADDRGVGSSNGDFAKATTADFATDAEAGMAYLLTRPEVDHHRLGLIGHSEGGEIAPMIAARNPAVSFVVLLAGPGVPGIDIITEQTRLLAEASGVPAALADKNAAIEHQILRVDVTEKDPALRDKRIRESLKGKVPDGQMDAQMKGITSPWFLYFLAYDPAPALRKLTCPVLALNGSKDLQVPPAQNLPALREALAANPQAEIDELPGLNHLFQTVPAGGTGIPGEYATIEETFAPVALHKIATWVLAQGGLRQ